MTADENTKDGYYWIRFDNGWDMGYLNWHKLDNIPVLHYMGFGQNIWSPMPMGIEISGPMTKPKG